jgi:hypothetical protein
VEGHKKIQENLTESLEYLKHVVNEINKVFLKKEEFLIFKQNPEILEQSMNQLKRIHERVNSKSIMPIQEIQIVPSIRVNELKYACFDEAQFTKKTLTLKNENTSKVILESQATIPTEMIDSFSKNMIELCNQHKMKFEFYCKKENKCLCKICFYEDPNHANHHKEMHVKLEDHIKICLLEREEI